MDQLYIVDTRTPTVLFHPKLYLVRGTERARLVIGSANLTIAGLNNNIEAGMLLDFDLADPADKALIENIETLINASVTDYPDHVVKVGNIADLDELLAAGRLVDERKILRHRDVSGTDSDDHDSEFDSDGDSDNVSRIELKVKPLQSGIVRAKAVPKELDYSKVSEATSAVNNSPIPANTIEVVNSRPIFAPRIECARESRVTHYVKRRAGEGPKRRARRAMMEAKQLRKKWYCTGDPCRYGHYSDRLVSNEKCRECNRLDSERSNRLGLYR